MTFTWEPLAPSKRIPRADKFPALLLRAQAAAIHPIQKASQRRTTVHGSARGSEPPQPQPHLTPHTKATGACPAPPTDQHSGVRVHWGCALRYLKICNWSTRGPLQFSRQ